MQIKYHSESVITNITLKINKKGKLLLSGTTPEQIEEGSLLIATNEERKNFFAYAALIMAVGTAIFAPLSAPLMIAYILSMGFNLGLVFCMPFWITIFARTSLDKKVKQCETQKNIINFTRRDLCFVLLKAFIFAAIFMSILIWLAASS